MAYRPSNGWNLRDQRHEVLFLKLPKKFVYNRYDIDYDPRVHKKNLGIVFDIKIYSVVFLKETFRKTLFSYNIWLLRYFKSEFHEKTIGKLFDMKILDVLTQGVVLI